MTTAVQRPPLNPVNVTIFVGLPLAALVLVPAWGLYHGYDAFQWLWALAFLAEFLIGGITGIFLGASGAGGSTFSLGFMTLPNVFARMPLGQVVVFERKGHISDLVETGQLMLRRHFLRFQGTSGSPVDMHQFTIAVSPHKVRGVPVVVINF